VIDGTDLACKGGVMNTLMTDTTKIRRSEDLLRELDDLLMSEEDGAHISLYCPAGRMPNEAIEGRIAFKNALAEAERSLKEMGESSDAIVESLLELRSLVDDMNFWNRQRGSIAVFVNSAGGLLLEIPAPLSSRAVVSNDFYLKPMMALAANLDTYFLLNISQKEVSLLRGSVLGLREVECPGLPENYADAIERLGYGDESRKQAAAESNLKAREDELKVFFQQIDLAVSRFLTGRDVPLIVAGDSSYERIYREVNTYENIAEVYIEGNSEHTDKRDLSEKANVLLHSDFKESQRRALNRFKMMDDVYEGRVARGLEEVIKAAASGRVAVGFLPGDAETWGTSDTEESPVISKSDGPCMASTELYEYAAREILGNGGEVFFLEERQLPTDAKAIAVLRWAANKEDQ